MLLSFGNLVATVYSSTRAKRLFVCVRELAKQSGTSIGTVHLGVKAQGSDYAMHAAH
jgi:hypothetical protein